MKKRARHIGIAILVLLAVSAVLSWPVAGWLEGRESWVAPGARVDAVYILAGNSDAARASGVAAWLQDGGWTGRILLSHDPSKGSWSRKDQRNLTMGEWAFRHLNEALAEADLDVPVEVVRLDMRGTDAEVASVARFAEERPDVRTIALATSRFHIRRTRMRASRYFTEAPGMIPGERTWQDRAPWVVGAELLKMLRDRLGLTKIVSRYWWRRGPEVGGRRSEVGGIEYE